MIMDPAVPGTFRAVGRVGELFIERFSSFIEAFHPQTDGSGNGEMIALGPDADGEEKNWIVRSPFPNVRFEISLDLNAVDRRKMVTWTWMMAEDLADGS